VAALDAAAIGTSERAWRRSYPLDERSIYDGVGLRRIRPDVIDYIFGAKTAKPQGARSQDKYRSMNRPGLTIVCRRQGKARMRFATILRLPDAFFAGLDGVSRA
jgi:hypothetical protein